MYGLISTRGSFTLETKTNQFFLNQQVEDAIFRNVQSLKLGDHYDSNPLLEFMHLTTYLITTKQRVETQL